jgi:molecular chaperone HtpG
MSALNGGMNFYGQLPESYTVTLNSSNEIIKSIITQKDSEIGTIIEEIEKELEKPKSELASIKERTSKMKYDEIPVNDKYAISELEKEIESIEKRLNEQLKNFAASNKIVNQLCDLALLSNNLLKGENLSKFVRRSYSLLNN